MSESDILKNGQSVTGNVSFSSSLSLSLLHWLEVIFSTWDVAPTTVKYQLTKNWKNKSKFMQKGKTKQGRLWTRVPIKSWSMNQTNKPQEQDWKYTHDIKQYPYDKVKI